VTEGKKKWAVRNEGRRGKERKKGRKKDSRSGAGAGFLRELRFPLPIYIPSASP
jgi:hypothetical protein